VLIEGLILDIKKRARKIPARCLAMQR